MGNEQELKECPFCGSDASVMKHPMGYKVSCRKPTKCLVPSTVHAKEKDAIRHWNTRKSTPSLQADEKELYKEIESLMLLITDRLDPHWSGFVDHAKAICAKFGTRRVTEEEIERVLDETDWKLLHEEKLKDGGYSSLAGHRRAKAIVQHINGER